MKFAPLELLEAFSSIFLDYRLGLFSISLSYDVTFEVFVHLTLSKQNAYLQLESSILIFKWQSDPSSVTHFWRAGFASPCLLLKTTADWGNPTASILKWHR